MLTTKKKLLFNTLISILLQIATVICAFILPRLILSQYGSEVNGLVSSIGQFLSLITFLEFGLGAVIPSALYKPLAEKNEDEISAIVTSGSKFFKRIALILLGYVIVLIIAFPVLVCDEFDWFYTALLILAMSVSRFAQYYFGIIDRLLLNADQRGFIPGGLQIVTLVLSTVVSVVLILSGASIQLVRLVTSAIFLIQPFGQRLYVRSRYRINRHFKYDGEPIRQKWNGIAQHVAAIVLNQTDVIVLTLFSSLSNVSIYSVYTLVVGGIRQLFLSASNGVQSLLGDLWARQDLDKLHEFFEAFEFGLHAAVVLLFSCTAVLIVPFVQVYTAGITDANYDQPLFALLITLAFAGYCLRLPYHLMIRAAGHYRETQGNYVAAAVINIVISVATVWWFGLVGVAVGTLVAMAYQTAWMAVYTSKNLVKRSISRFVRLVVFDMTASCIIALATSFVELASLDYVSWVIMACQVLVIALVVVTIASMLFYRDQVRYILNNMGLLRRRG